MEEITKKILEKRGIISEEDIEEFFSSKPKLTYDSSLLPDIDEGVKLILNEINNNSKIMIYGDYDCDGITATSLMYEVLTQITNKENVSYYIPKRDKEGYGLNKDAILYIKNLGFDFIITVDCGSTSYEEVEYAKELGLKILVTDHHNITEKQANCLLINPKRPDSKYPFKELSGVGVSFKVVQELSKNIELGKDILTRILDLVAIGTVADIMSLRGENRTLLKYGLRVINIGSRKGLKLLIENIGLKLGEINASNIGFVISPHLNASGRMDDAKIAVELMVSNDDSRLEEIVGELILKNVERKKYQETAFELGKDLLKNNDNKFIFLRLDNSHEGILGIVAGKIKEEYYRPTVILSKIKDSDLIKGTGRSIPGIDIYSVFNKYEELFVKFGGHSGACGFTISEENFNKLEALVLSDMEKIDQDVFIKKEDYDLEIDNREININLLKELELFEPFGKDNKKPKFKINVDINDVIYMGEEKKHLKFLSNGITYVLFNKAKEYDLNEIVGKNKKVIGELGLKYFKGNHTMQVIIEEIK